MTQINTLVIEDDAYMREVLQRTIAEQSDFLLQRTYSSIEQLLEERLLVAPDVVLLDIGLPGRSGIEGIPFILDRYPQANITMLSTYVDSDSIFESLCAGAVSYLSKQSNTAEILNTLRIVAQGGAYMSPGIARKVVAHFRKEKRNPYQLTARQQQITECIIKGMSYKLIAAELHISVETVRDHIKKIYKKLGVHSKTEVLRKRLDGEL